MDTNKKHWALFGLINAALIAGIGVGTGVVDFGRTPSEQALRPQPVQPETSGLKKDEAKVDDADQSAKASGDAKTPAAKVAEKADAKEPAFDVLRVEKDGSLLAAGRAKPNSKVELVSPDGTVIAETKADQSGDFVLLPEKQVPAGDHVFNLRSKDENSDAVVSKETGIVHIPKDDKDEVLAMVTKEGAASRILVKPERFNLSEDETPAKKSEPLVKQEETQTPKESEVAAATPEVKPEVSAPTDNSKAPQVAVEAVEVEDGNIYVAGSAKSGSPVRVYIDNKKLGDTKGTSNNRFLLEKKFELSPGEHSVRADLVGGKDGKVVARAEVPLIHEPQKTRNLAKKEPATPEAAVPVPNKDETQTENAPQTAVAEANVPRGLIRTGSSIIIKRRDNLWRISTKTYGRGFRYTTIFNANRDQIRDPDLIYPGQIFKLPENATN